MKLRYLLIATLPTLLATQPVVAQTEVVLDTLVREIVIENEYTPIVQEASKINQLPAVETPTIEKSHINYSSWATPLSLSPQKEQLGATPFETTKAFSTERGYLDLAMGNYWNTAATAGYRVLDNPIDSLAIWLKHNGTYGKLNFVGTEKETTQRINNNQIDAAYRRLFVPFDLHVNANYAYNLFNYYGYNGSGDAPLQQVNQLGVEAGIVSSPTLHYNYTLFVGYNMYSNDIGVTDYNKGVGENHIWADIQLGAQLNELFDLGVDVRYDQLLYNESIYEIANYGMFTANPYITGKSGDMRIRAGIIANLSFNNQEFFNIAPDLSFEWEFAPSYLVTATAKGGKKLNTMQQMAQECLYMNPEIVAPNSYTPIDAKLAISTNALPSFWLELYGGYCWTKNAAVAAVQPSTTNLYYTGVVAYEATNINYWQAGATAKYRYNSLLEATVDVHTNICNISYMHTLPKLEARAALLVRPLQRLSVEASYYLAMDREAYVLNDAIYSMDDVHNLQLTANYAITKKIDINLQLNNLLFQEYDVWYGMPAQGFSAMLGAGFIF